MITHRSKHTISLVLGLLLISGSNLLCLCPLNSSEVANGSDEKEGYDMRKELEFVMKAMTDRADPKSIELRMKQMFGSLLLAFKENPVKYHEDLVAFEISALKANNENAIGLGALARHIGSSSQAQALEAVLPLLTQADEPTRIIVNRHLRHIEKPSPRLGPDFSWYQSHIQPGQNALSDVEAALAQRMFSLAPSNAFAVFVDTYETERSEKNKLRWAEKIIADNLWKRNFGFLKQDEVEPDAKAQVEFLSQRPEYWARLYVAEIIKQHPQFGTEELIKKLRMDSHVLVQQAASKIGVKSNQMIIESPLPSVQEVEKDSVSEVQPKN